MAKWLERRMPQSKIGRGHEETYRLPTAGLYSRPNLYPSYFAVPVGTAKWLATDI
ncbi:MAG: hypothetical protein IKI83_02645 [Prevotella sp.]|nr:hypothetical protein [Prevotella sp.]